MESKFISNSAKKVKDAKYNILIMDDCPKYTTIENIISTKECCGCGVCANICPVNAITLIYDEEYFLYPHIDQNKCTSCKKCDNSCPILNLQNIHLGTHNLSVYAGYQKDTAKCKSCTSGGAATAISEKIIREGGVVYGVEWSDNFTKARHASASSLPELEKFKGSKYIQSDKGNIYHDIIYQLDTKRKVLFIGLPCEVAAVKSYLKKEYAHLFTIELICHAVTSEKIAEEYLQHLSTTHDNKKIIYFSPRHTGDSWNKVYMRADFEDNSYFQKEFFQTEYGMAFMLFSRPSCYNCRYKGDNRVGDITIGDFWGLPKHNEAWNRYGVSNIFIHTEKGKEMISGLEGFRLFESGIDLALLSQPLVNKSVKRSQKRDYLSNEIQKNGLIVACHNTGFKKYIIKQKIMGILKYILFNWVPFKLQIVLVQHASKRI